MNKRHSWGRHFVALALAAGVALLTVTKNDIQTTSTDGVVIQNSTAATVGVPEQYSPRLRFHGTAWDTDDAVSRTVDWVIQNEPQDGIAPLGNLSFDYSIDGAAYTTGCSMDAQGRLNVALTVSCPNFLSVSSTLIDSGGLTMQSAGTIEWSSTGVYTGTKDIRIDRQEASTLAFGDGTNDVLSLSLDGSAPTAFSVTDTSGVDVHFRARDGNGTDKAGGGFWFQLGGRTGTGTRSGFAVNRSDGTLAVWYQDYSYLFIESGCGGIAFEDTLTTLERGTSGGILYTSPSMTDFKLDFAAAMSCLR